MIKYKLKEGVLGSEYTVEYNMIRHTVTISNDPAKFEYYQTLGLDVLEEVKEFKPRGRRSKKIEIKEEE